MSTNNNRNRNTTGNNNSNKSISSNTVNKQNEIINKIDDSIKNVQESQDLLIVDEKVQDDIKTKNIETIEVEKVQIPIIKPKQIVLKQCILKYAYNKQMKDYKSCMFEFTDKAKVHIDHLSSNHAVVRYNDLFLFEIKVNEINRNEVKQLVIDTIEIV